MCRDVLCRRSQARIGAHCLLHGGGVSDQRVQRIALPPARTHQLPLRGVERGCGPRRGVRSLQCECRLRENALRGAGERGEGGGFTQRGWGDRSLCALHDERST